MRNEIFKRIQKSRNKYYSELKLRKIEKEISDGNIKEIENKPAEKDSKDNPDSKNRDSKSSSNSILKFKLRTIKSIPESQLIAEQISKKIDFLKSQYLHANKKVKTKSDKLADGFYDFSSRIFDDKYSFEERTDPNMNQLSLITPNGQRLEWTINYEEDNRTIMEELIFLPEVFQSWIKSILINIMLWFNADEIAEIKEVSPSRNSNSSKFLQYCSDSSKKMSAIDYIEKLKKVKIFKNHHLISEEYLNEMQKKNQTITSAWIDYGRMRFFQVNHMLKSFSSINNKFIVDNKNDIHKPTH